MQKDNPSESNASIHASQEPQAELVPVDDGAALIGELAANEEMISPDGTQMNSTTTQLDSTRIDVVPVVPVVAVEPDAVPDVAVASKNPISAVVSFCWLDYIETSSILVWKYKGQAIQDAKKAHGWIPSEHTR